MATVIGVMIVAALVGAHGAFWLSCRQTRRLDTLRWFEKKTALRFRSYRREPEEAGVFRSGLEASVFSTFTGSTARSTQMNG